jgi:hypothetical protein
LTKNMRIEPEWVCSWLTVLRSLLVALALGASVTLAAPADDILSVRARGGIAVRSGEQLGGGRGVTYSGITGNDLALGAWWFFAWQHRIGLTAQAQWEAFSVSEAGMRAGQVSLLRLLVGPVIRARFGPLRLEGTLAYALHQQPYFGPTSAPNTLSAVARHGVSIGARALLDVGPLTFEVKGELPFGLALSGAPAGATAWGGTVGGGIRLQLFATGALHWGLWGEFTWTPDTYTFSPEVTGRQSVLRPGLGLDLQLRAPAPAEVSSDPVPSPAIAKVVVECRDEAGAAMSATVTLDGASPTACDETGTVTLSHPTDREVSVRGSASGFTPVTASIAADAAGPIRLTFARAPGVVSLTIIDRETKAPVTGATVALNGAPQTSMQLTLAPGLYPLTINADGYEAKEETVSVAAGKTSAVTVVLNKLAKRIPATLTVLVRNAKTGGPLKATAELLGTKFKAAIDGKGSLTVPGGSYTLKVTAPRHVTQTKTVTLQDGNEAIFNLDLNPQ